MKTILRTIALLLIISMIGCGSKVPLPEDRTIVWVSAHDPYSRFYHRENCLYLANKRMPIAEYFADKRGFEPCFRCNPGTIVKKRETRRLWIAAGACIAALAASIIVAVNSPGFGE